MQFTSLTTQGHPLTKRPGLGLRSAIWLTSGGRRGEVEVASASELQSLPARAELASWLSAGSSSVCSIQGNELVGSSSEEPEVPSHQHLQAGPAQPLQQYSSFVPLAGEAVEGSIPLLLACLLGVFTSLLHFQGQVLLSLLAYGGSSERRAEGRVASHGVIWHYSTVRY